MSKFAILLAGNLKPTERLMRQLNGARCIAADGGMVHAALLQLIPELWVGDFDSTPKQLAAKWHNVPRQTHPVAKNASDGELAITEALKRGATSLILVGGLGGQTDHMLAHLGMLLALGKRGIPVFATSGGEEAWPLIHSLALDDLQPHTRLSIMPLSDLAQLSITGVKYALTNANVKLGTALTLANVSEGPVRLNLVQGLAVVMIYPK